MPRDQFDDELPFDELDPCCQKEIINERKKKEVNSKLRKVDRSTKRTDLQKTVFSFLGVNCACCQQQPFDYDALRVFKSKMAATEYQRQTSNQIQGDDDEEDDDDSLLNDIPLTEEEQLRIQQVNQHLLDLEKARKYGVGVYKEDSLLHILELASNPTVPLVLHLYQPHSPHSAMIDYYLETIFCEAYLGTRFRRMPFSIDLLTNDSINENWKKSFANANDLLVCIKSNDILCCQNKNFALEFGDHPDDVLRNLNKWLEASHCLVKELPHPSQLFPSANGSLNNFGEEEEEEDLEEVIRYCEDPDCIKRFPHEHVGKSSSSSASFLFSNNRQGEDEVLAPNLMRRL
jgi:hypothetical protein